MRALKIAGAAIGAVIVVIALLAVIGIPSGFLTSAIQDRVEHQTGYRLAINGGAKISLWPSLHITLNDIALQDPKDREINNRLTASSIQAVVTLASLWSGQPHVTDLLIVRPVLTMPLQRVREPNPPAGNSAAGTGEAKFGIEHVSVTGGTIVFANVRDRVEGRIETINADMAVGSDRKIVISGNGRGGGQPLKFEIKATAPAAPIERQNIPTEIAFEAPGLLQAPLSARTEVRLSGAVMMFNGVSGTLGDGAFNGWASVDIASNKPLVKLDLDFQKLSLAMERGQPGTASQPWSSATFDLIGLNYVDAQAKISAAELNIGDGRFAPAAIEATLMSGVMKARLANLGAYEGNANGDLAIDVTTSNQTYALGADLNNVRALPLLRSLADFDKLDGRMQAKIAVRSSGNSQRAIMGNMSGTAFAVFRDGAIRGLNVAQMIRSLTTSPLSGWQEGDQLATDLSQLSASFKIDKGQAVTTDLNLVGPLVKMTGVGTIDLGTKMIGFRVEPKLVLTTEGQGRTADPVGLGIPVMVEGPWDGPRIYPEMQGMLDNPEAAYAKLREMGKGLFGPNGALGGLLGGSQGSGAGTQGGSANGQSGQGGGLLGGQLGETIGNLIQQGLNSAAQPPRPSRSIPPAQPQQPEPPPQSAPPSPPSDSGDTQDSQAMNEVLRQLFNR
ncbi:AsmA family protein [Bradyrhizobium neotropicale]|uniref:AsmA family protein n=1 Tax=Bradyrhizobium neotropicale TaxID=1497615 RepID=UPI001AD73401|nr:AsmA family protein [Bradyrhizobium neotropicale]MBO4227392.1 AsmA family protein [Bradyrhizobium neotropicale]